MRASINLGSRTDIRPEADVLTLADGRRFIALDLGECSIILPGLDGAAAEFAQRLAQAVDNANLEILHAPVLPEPSEIDQVRR